MNAHTFSADLATATVLDWRERPEVAMLLDAIRANRPPCHMENARHINTRDEWLVYDGPVVAALRVMWEREMEACRVDKDAGDRTRWDSFKLCDPAWRDGPCTVPSILRDSSEVDRIIYEAIEGGAGEH